MKAKRIERTTLLVLLTLIVVGVLLSFFDLHFFEKKYVVEDGPLEWLTVVALLIGAYICIKRIASLRKSKPLFFLICTGILACLFLFGAGEEISWGQRLLGIESSDFFKKHNAQAETNLHNLVFRGKKINKIIFGTTLGIFIALYLLLLPYLFRKVKGIQKFVKTFAMPIPQNVHIYSYIILFALASISPSSKKGELLEFGGSILFLLIIHRPLNLDLFKK